ncbi:MAG: EamA family transporter [Bacteroidetes bacterium]|nr:MAG: EamA family transporter [Bacteroidota bacterium]
MKHGYNKWILFLSFACVYVIWGSTYLAILFGLKGFAPFLLCAIRFLLAGFIILSWCFIRGEKRPSIRSIRINSICGACMLFAGVGSVCWAEQYLPSSLAAIIVTALPFWFVILDKRQWSFYFSNKFIMAGLLIGFAGVALLLGFGKQSSFSPDEKHKQVIATMVLLMGGICWSFGSLYSKYHKTGDSFLMNGGIQFFIAGLLSLVVSGISGEWNNFQWIRVGNRAWLAVGYLVSMGSLVTYLAYLFLLKVKPAAQVSTYVYVNPVVALFLGVWLAHESITPLRIVALSIILIGVLLVNIPVYKPGAGKESNKKVPEPA